MRKLKLIGIGAGNPDYITMQARWVRLGTRAPENVQQVVALTETFRSTRAESL
jgi:precorrin-2 methylase